jgi:hypothetical protein
MKKRTSSSVIITNSDDEEVELVSQKASATKLSGERRPPKSRQKKMKSKPCDAVDLLAPTTTTGSENDPHEGKILDLLGKGDDSNTFLVDEIMEHLPVIDVEESQLGARPHSNSYVQHHESDVEEEEDEKIPIPLCHNIVSTSQIRFSLQEIDLQRLASLFPFTSYDRKRFAAITIRLANPHCTCLLFGSGKLVITGSTSFHACIVASQTITDMLREVNPRQAAVGLCSTHHLIFFGVIFIIIII